MKNKQTRIIIIALLSLVLQAGHSLKIYATKTPTDNDGFNYQAVVRDGDGNLLANAAVTVEFTIQSTIGDVWIESHNTTSNAYGMINLIIGTGDRTGGSSAEFSGIDWSSFLSLKVQIDTGTGLTDLGTFDLKSVPYANYAANGLTPEQSELLSAININAEENVQSDWNETESSADGFILNKPIIPSDVNQLSDSDGLLMGSTFDGKFTSLTEIPVNLDTDVTDDFSGDYADLTNTPSIPKDVSELSDEEGLLSITSFDGKFSSLTEVPENLDTDVTDDFSGDYNDLANAPTIPADLNELNDVEGKLFSGSYGDLTDVPANIDTDATDDFSGDYADLANKPTIPSDINELSDADTKLFSGSYNDLRDQPTIPVDLNQLTDADGKLFSGSFNALDDLPENLDTDATDDFSGDYNALTNKPTIPSDINELSDADAKLFSGSYNDLRDQPIIPLDLNQLTDTDSKLFSGSFSDLNDLPVNLDTDATDDFSGDYNDLAKKPTIPSDLNELNDVEGKLFSGSYSDLADVPANLDTDATDDFSGSYNDLTDLPANLDIDATDDFSGSFNDLADLPANLDVDSNDDFDGAFSSLTGVPTNLDTDATDDFSGSYNDLRDIPVNIDTDATDDFSGSFADLTNVPAKLDTDSSDDFDGAFSSLIGVPTNLDIDATDDFSGSYADLKDVPANLDTDASDDFSGSFTDLTNVPANLDTDSSDDFDGAFSSLTGVPTNLDTDASDDFSGSYADLTDVPVNIDIDATDDFSGDYSDLTNKPTIIGSLATHSATELSDITDAGSGIIISDAERSSFTNSAATVTSKSADWDAAHTWGDHSAEDYLKVVTGANITDATIGNEDISGSAAISSSKLEATVVVAGEGNAQLLNDAGYLLAADQVVTKTGNLIQTGDTDDDFLYGSTQLDNIDGIGTDDGRIFFDKSKGAFRAGVASGDQWDETNIGDFSAVVGGAGNKASGLQSAVVGGLFNTATAERSISAGGYLNNATGDYSNVYGGLFNNATNNRSSVLGGESNTASGGFATVSGGYQNTASGAYSHASGLSNSAGSYGETVIGHYATVEAGQNAGGVTYTDRLFAVGNGLDNDSRSNALELNKQGDMKLAGGLEVNSTTEGFLPPRMTTAQRDAIASPAIGLTIFNTETVSLEFYTGKIWFSMGGCTPLALAPTSVAAIAKTYVSAEISFTSVGGETSYTVVSIPEGISASGSTSPITVSGLSEGVDYVFSVISSNDCGDSPSVQTNSITASCAQAPTITSMTAIENEATISFSTASSTGSFTAVSNPGGFSATSTSSPLVVSGLTVGTQYTFDLTTTETCGTSAVVTSNPITPCDEIGQAPTEVTAALGDDGRSIIVSFVPSGGENSFLVESLDGTLSQTISSSPVTFEGIAVNTNHSFNVTALTGCVDSSPVATNSVTTYFRTTNAGVTYSISNNIYAGSNPRAEEDYTIDPGGDVISSAYPNQCTSLDDQGKTDWFLPSNLDLQNILTSLDNEGGVGRNEFNSVVSQLNANVAGTTSAPYYRGPMWLSNSTPSANNPGLYDNWLYSGANTVSTFYAYPGTAHLGGYVCVRKDIE